MKYTQTLGTSVVPIVTQSQLGYMTTQCTSLHMNRLNLSSLFSAFRKGKGYMHGRAANVHLAIRTANCRGRYCCRVNSPEKAHSYLHGRRAVNHALNYLHGGCRAGKSCIWLFARQIKFAAPGKRYTL